MRFLRERVFLLASVVLLLSAVLAVRQFAANRTRHAELREAFIAAHQKGHSVEALAFYQRLKYAMPGEPTGHLIDDLARTTPLTPADQSPVTNVLVRYHLSVKHEVEKRLAARFKPAPPL